MINQKRSSTYTHESSLALVIFVSHNFILRPPWMDRWNGQQHLGCVLLGWTTETNPPASAGQGQQGCGIDLIAFLTINNHCYSAIWLCCYVFRGLKSGYDSPHQIPDPRLTFRYIIKNRFIFEHVSKTRKSENGFQGSQKKANIDSIIHLKRFPWTVHFCNTFYAKTTILKS